MRRLHGFAGLSEAVVGFLQVSYGVLYSFNKVLQGCLEGFCRDRVSIGLSVFWGQGPGFY